MKGHDGQEKTFGGAQGQEHEELGHTAAVTDRLPAAAGVYQHLRDRACGVAKVPQGQIGKKEVRGGVEFGVQLRHKNYCQIAKDSHDVGNQEDRKEWGLQPWSIRETEEDRLPWDALVHLALISASALCSLKHKNSGNQ